MTMKHSTWIAATLCLLTACASSPRSSRRSEGDRWFSVGIQHVDPDTGGVFSDKATGLTLEGGLVLDKEKGLERSVEGLLQYSVHDASVQWWDSSTTSWRFKVEEPVNLKLGVGGRLTWTDMAKDWRLYVRGGLLYQYWYDDFIDDSGIGFYAGGGADYEVQPNTWIGPFLQFSSVGLDDIDVDEMVLGAKVTFGF